MRAFEIDGGTFETMSTRRIRSAPPPFGIRASVPASGLVAAAESVVE